MSFWRKVKKILGAKKNSAATNDNITPSHQGVEVDSKGKEKVDVDEVKQLY